MRIRRIAVLAAFAAGLAALPLATAKAQYYPPCSSFPLFWPFCVAGAIVGTAATIVTAPFVALTAPPYYYGYYGRPYYAPPSYPAPGYYAPPYYYYGRAEPTFAKYGGLINHSAKREDVDQAAAAFVDKILNGAKAAELPVHQPTTFELLINSALRKKQDWVEP